MCQKILSSKRILQRHVKEKHTDKKYNCKQCGRPFARKDALKRHTKTTHTQERPHVCPICPDETTFKTRDHLNVHVKRHDRAKHQCDRCNLKFLTADALEKHKKLH